MTDRSLTLRCGSCGADNQIDIGGAEEAAREQADAITDEELAQRYRLAFRRMVERVMPQKLTRLPLAYVDTLADDVVIAAGRDVLTLMLTPSGR